MTCKGPSSESDYDDSLALTYCYNCDHSIQPIGYELSIYATFSSHTKLKGTSTPEAVNFSSQFIFVLFVVTIDRTKMYSVKFFSFKVARSDF